MRPKALEIFPVAPPAPRLGGNSREGGVVGLAGEYPRSGVGPVQDLIGDFARSNAQRSAQAPSLTLTLVRAHKGPDTFAAPERLAWTSG